jgi:copper homeostasis protein
MEKELCVGSLEAARLAADLNLDRIETCIALEQGGLTASIAMVNWIAETFDLPQYVLIRQRAGGFVYSYDEIIVMREQINQFQNSEIEGFVIGALTNSNEIDLDTIEIWKRASKDKKLVFHRAFDEIVDWKKAIDQLIKLGFIRILTSPKVGGMERIKELQTYASGRIEIMPAGGVKPEMIEDFKSIGLTSFHFSGTQLDIHSPNSVFSAEVLIPKRELISHYL